MIVERLISGILNLEHGSLQDEYRVKIFSWLIATETLELKFAFANHAKVSGIFHDKLGLFKFSDGEKIAFSGSANETIYGHEINYESIDVYRSWVPEDKSRVLNKERDFEEAWSNTASGLIVKPLSEDTIRMIKVRAPSHKPIPPDKPKLDVRPRSVTSPVESASSKTDIRWLHQSEAVERVIQLRSGIIEMATGTGKTHTALQIFSVLLDRDQIDSAIVTTIGNDLLDQWSSEISSWLLNENRDLAIVKHYDTHKNYDTFVLDPSDCILLISLNQLGDLFQRLSPDKRHRTIIVHDEVHGLGVPTAQERLHGQHKYFPYRLGLSATPEREYDEQGNNFIESEIGEIIFSFPIEAAIARGTLCEFDYVALDYDLTPNDQERIQMVYRKQAARKHAGNPMTKEELWIDIARVHKTAEMKPVVFREYLQTHPNVLNRTIIFVDTKEYGEKILSNLQEYTHLYRTYYAEDDRDNLVAFSKGEIDCLITCHRISQGIDIQSLKNIVLLSSARAKLETIQRIGRCLRTEPLNPNKKATVIDFVRITIPASDVLSADQTRCEWLSELSKVKRGDQIEH